MAKSSRNPKNEVTRTIYASLAQDARHRQVANEFFGGNISAALTGRFDDVENLFGIAAYLRPRVVAAAAAAGLTIRDYVIKVFTEHAMTLPEAAEEKGPGRKVGR